MINRRRRSNSGFIVLGLIIVGIIIGAFFLRKPHTTTKSVQRAEKDVYTILLLGYGGGNHDGAYLTDSMMVARVDLKKKTVDLISIPRDVWVKLATKSGDTFGSKINAVYQMGMFPKTYPDVKQLGTGDDAGGLLVKKVVSTVLGIPVDYYVTIDFDGFAKAVDTLGGVNVKVPKTFDDYEYPIDGKEKELCGHTEEEIKDLDDKIATGTPAFELFPCRYEHLHFDAGYTQMDGATALKFVRSRHALADGSDFGRAARQQVFVDAVKQKVLQVNFIPKIVPLMEELSSHVQTDVPLGEMQRLIRELPSAKNYTKRTLVLSNQNVLMNNTGPGGAFILTTKDGIHEWTPVHTIVKNLISGVELDATGAAKIVTPTHVPTKKK